jgi:ParB family chromosome partitioning protein
MASLREGFEQYGSGKTSPSKLDVLPCEEARLVWIAVDAIEPDPQQPRSSVKDVSALKESIRENTILQPLIVSPLPTGKFLLVAGHRRLAAAVELGFAKVPAIVREVDERERLLLQLVENMQRVELDPWEEANGYKRLAEDFRMTDEKIAGAVGRTRSHVTQMRSLLHIPLEVRKQCQRNDSEPTRETLILMAKQDSPADMMKVLAGWQAKLPKNALRETARKGAPRGDTSGRRFVIQISKNVTVTVTSTTKISRDSAIASLLEASRTLQQVRGDDRT